MILNSSSGETTTNPNPSIKDIVTNTFLGPQFNPNASMGKTLSPKPNAVGAAVENTRTYRGKQLNSGSYGGKLYHGTQYPFKPGDTVNARRSWYGVSSTPDIKMAQGYASGRFATAEQRKSIDYKPRVYEVRPNGAIRQPYIDRGSTTPKFNGMEYTSPSFTVVKEVGKLGRAANFVQGIGYPKGAQVGRAAVSSPTEGYFFGSRRQKDGW